MAIKTHVELVETQNPSPLRDPILSAISTDAKKSPERIVVHGREGIGKTSFAAFAPGCIFLQTAGETGLETLIQHKRIPPTAHFPETTKWESIVAVVKSLMTGAHEYKNLVIDTLDGAEAMLSAWVLANEFAGSTAEFQRWGRGSDAVLNHFRNFILGLDMLRQHRSMGIILLSHSVSINSEDESDDFRTWTPCLTTRYKNATTWSIVNAFADTVLYLDYERVFRTKDGKERIDPTGDARRVLYTEMRPGWIAKNRHGMPPKIILGDEPKDAWDEINKYL